MLRLVDTPHSEAEDSEVLELAATEGRIVVSRDKKTLRDFAPERVSAGKRMAGLLVVRRRYLDRQAGISAVVEALQLVAAASEPSEWEGVIDFIPYLDS